MRDGGGGCGGSGGVSASGGGAEGRLLHGRLARQKLLEDGVHLAADHLLDGGEENRWTVTTAKKKNARYRLTPKPLMAVGFVFFTIVETC